MQKANTIRISKRTEALAESAIRIVERRVGCLPGRVALVLEHHGIVICDRELALDRLRDAEYFPTADALEAVDAATLAASMAVVVCFANDEATCALLFPVLAGVA
jgi:hypothetical protein